MELEKLEKSLNDSYSHKFKSINTRVAHSIKLLDEDSQIDMKNLSLVELKTIATTILDKETTELNDDVGKLLEKKEQIERDLERKAQELQNSKYDVFDALEESLTNDSDTIAKLHQVKLQSIDLYNFLSEMVESAIITALEKSSDGDIDDSIQEIIKEITYEAIKQGSLNTIRIRKILSTILHSAIEVSEATPTKAQDILTATLRGMRSGLIESIKRFKQRIAYMPVEAKHILIEDYDTIMEDLSQSDILFSQVIQTQAEENSPSTKELLLSINSSMRYDLQELVHISKEAADLVKERFSTFAKTAAKTADTAMKSQKAQEAKKMGIQAWDIAKTAMQTSIKSAKDAMDNKNSKK